jgi:pyridoxal/pyridoxine/pyridoxamine kinase
MELPLVQLTKLRASPTAVCPAGNWDEYRLGAADNSTSLPVDYVLVGYLLTPPQVGHVVRIIRVSRNGVPVLGVFVSTVVQQLIAEGFVTENSVYRLE